MAVATKCRVIASSVTAIVFLCILHVANFKPVNVNRTISEHLSQLAKNKDLLPQDHLEGVRLHRDGDINKDFHHEAFLGKLVKEGAISFENMSGYKKLIEVFHKVDTDKDHLISKDEMKAWIHQKILEHLEEAENKNEELFKKVDSDRDGSITWKEYLHKLIEDKAGNRTVIDEEAEDGGFPEEFSKWKRADQNNDDKLTEKEFLYFQHPEHNPSSIKEMAEDMVGNFDRNKDKVLTEEEFVNMPAGEVDPDEENMDKEYEDERKKEFHNMDVDKNGVVDIEELKQFLDPKHPQHAVNEANYLVSAPDRNGDGKLSEREMLINYHLFTGSSLSNFASVLHDEF